MKTSQFMACTAAQSAPSPPRKQLIFQHKYGVSANKQRLLMSLLTLPDAYIRQICRCLYTARAARISSKWANSTEKYHCVKQSGSILTAFKPSWPHVVKEKLCVKNINRASRSAKGDRSLSKRRNISAPAHILVWK